MEQLESNIEELKQDIEEQISSIEDSFINRWGRPLFHNRGLWNDDNDIFSNDIELLEGLLKKVNRQFKYGKIVSNFIFAFFLLLVLFLLFNELYFNFKVELININIIALVIISLGLIKSTYAAYYKVKVNLEHKIYLLRLINKISKVEN